MTTRSASAPKLLLAFYGDDFTGSTDAMEALALSGLRTVLFLAPPKPELLRDRFADVRCIGVAGTSRAMSPAEMADHLPPIFRALRSAGAPIVHYKVCSTFDSSATVGSIGRVIDIARREFTEGRVISLLAGAPPLRRYTVFGNHFAAAGDRVYRLDRHPTMSRHPITPMDEPDLRVHLARQTDASISLMSIVDLEGSAAEVDARYAAKLEDKPHVLFFDVLDDARLQTAGRLIWEQGARGQHFSVGSSGVEYALTAHWRASGMAEKGTASFGRLEPVRQLLVVSGSCSPVTAAQIEWASLNGFDCIRAPAQDFVNPGAAESARRALFERAMKSLSAGESPLIYSASGPDDPSIGATRNRMAEHGQQSIDTGKLLGQQLGRLTRELLAASGLRRVVIAGGDTSSFATQELGLYGLEMTAPAAPGSPLCRAYSEEARFDRLEIALKGGQMGQPDYFGRVRGSP